MAWRAIPPMGKARPAMKQLVGSLGVKLFFWIFCLMVVVFASFTFLSLDRTSKTWIDSVEQQAGQTCAVVERVLRYGMLLNRKDDVYNNLRNIAKEPGIETIRIYDKRGQIVFSTEQDEIDTQVDRNSDACLVCHDANQELHAASNITRTQTYRDVDGSLMMSRLHPIENAPQCATAECHEHPAEQRVLGVLDLRMSLDVVDKGRRQTTSSFIQATGLMAIVGGLVAALFIWHFVRAPVLRLVAATQRVAAGDMNPEVEFVGSGEIAELGRAFKRMTAQLSQAQDEKRKWEDELEAAVLRKTEELSRAQRQMTHMERMASLGKLAATVAHELNNPLAGILVYAKLVLRELEEAKSGDPKTNDSKRYLEAISREASRCGDIVRNLLAFSRQSRTRMEPFSINEVIDRSLMTIGHLIKQGEVEVKVEPQAGEDPIWGDANQMQQALIALIVNAVEAMPGGGELRISTSRSDAGVVLEISDTGTGIAPDVLPNIFEPFVSTKGDEKGVGLGLAVVYGIVRRHEGDIDVQSEVGAGTTFRLTFPHRDQSHAVATEATGPDQDT